MTRGLPKDYDTSGLPSYMDHFMNGPQRGAIYFLEAPGLSLVKIGATNLWRQSDNQASMDQESRISTLTGQAFVELQPVVITTAVSIGSETQHHDYFEHFRYRQKREWFWFIDDLRDYVEKLAVWVKKMDDYATEVARYNEAVRRDPALEDEESFPPPEMPLDGPWLDFKNGGHPKPRRKPSGWELKY